MKLWCKKANTFLQAFRNHERDRHTLYTMLYFEDTLLVLSITTNYKSFIKNLCNTLLFPPSQLFYDTMLMIKGC